MPSIHDLKTKLAGRPETHPYVPPPELTPEQRKRSDHAAVLSMLWLHYAQGWDLRDFAGHALGRLFGRDPTQALEAAKQVYDLETVLRWMDDQQGAGN